MMSCSSKSTSFLENGDLLFVAAKDSLLSGAIDRVTQTEEAHHYSHIALIEKDEAGKYWVLHAGTRNGSERIPLDSFMEYAKEDHSQLDVYRLKKEYRKAIPSAIKTAKTWLGKPYNYTYVLSDEKLYCSDFIQRSFASDAVFDLNPMTFINPQTGKIDETWVTFYNEQGLKVPEGKPGCNPNGIAASHKIKFIRILDAEY